MITMPVERLLAWGFLMATPDARDGTFPSNGGGSAWAAIERYAELGTLVDGGRGFGVSYGADDVVPLDDAVAIVDAVGDLDDMTIVEGDEHDLLAGWPDFGPAGERAVARAWDMVTCLVEGRLTLRGSLSAMVRRAAILNRWPDWRCETPELVAEVGPTGRPRWYRSLRRPVRWDDLGQPIGWEVVEVDGYDARRQRLHPGAYRRSTLSPDPTATLARRLEYGIVHAAMTTLAARLDGLGWRRILPPSPSPTPWAAARSASDEN